MLISILIIVALLTALIIGKLSSNIRFKNKVRHLHALSKPILDKNFSYAQLASLPTPLQRYFTYVLTNGQPYISYVKLLHDGQFKAGLDKDWIDIKGEQYFTTEKPGFIWKGATKMFTAYDMYVAGKGRLIVSLLSIFNVVNEYGDSYNQGELLRWLAEGVWFPTNLLPSDKLSWLPINENTAKLTYIYEGISLFYIVTFNEIGEITQMETKRYINKDKLETWIGRFGNYQKMNGIVIPKSVEAIWRLETGEISYAKFGVTKIFYD